MASETEYMAIDIAGAKRVAADLYTRTVTSAPMRAALDRYVVDTDELRTLTEGGGRRYDLDASDQVTFDPPTCLGDVPDAVGQHVGRHVVDAPFVARLRDCQLIGPDGLTTLPDGRYVLENVLRSEDLFWRAFAATLRAGVLPVRWGGRDAMLDSAVSLVGPWCRGYYHWFAEWLPRLEGVEQFAERTGTTPTVVAPPDPPGWMRESLRLVGFDDYVTWNGGRVDVADLVVPSLRRAHPVDSPDQYTNTVDGYRWIRDRVLENLDPVPDTDTNRVYVSRRRADERHVVNEDELLDSLSAYGFEAYELETMSFPEQVRLFAGADAVVSPHGAGLVNAIYGTDLTVVELFGEYVNGCYYTMADGLGFDYGFLECEPVRSDMRVDVDRLETLLEKML